MYWDSPPTDPKTVLMGDLDQPTINAITDVVSREAKMETTATGQRRRVSRKPREPHVIRAELRDGMGNPRWLTADLLNPTEGGFGLALMTPLRAGGPVAVRGRLGA